MSKTLTTQYYRGVKISHLSAIRSNLKWWVKFDGDLRKFRTKRDAIAFIDSKVPATI